MTEDSRGHLLRLIADRRDGTLTLPDAIEGLAPPHTPAIYFYDGSLTEVGLWLVALNAHSDASVKPFDGFTVTTWYGHHLGLDVEIKLSQGDK